MKNLAIVFLVMLPFSSSCQTRFPKFKPVIIDTSEKFFIKDENKPLKIFEEDSVCDTIRSSLIVNGDELRHIWFTKNVFKKDTLLIEIYSTNQVYSHQYVIKIFEKKYSVEYRYEMDGPEFERKVTPIEYTVKLNNLDFKKGKQIRGYTEFKGTCIGEGCSDPDIEIKGNFKILIE